MANAVIHDAEPARRRSKRTATQVEVVVQDRAYDAHKLRLAGLDWIEIAKRVGYLDGRVAWMAVTAMLQRVAAEQTLDHRQQALDLELARLDQLQVAFYPAAMAGDVAAGTRALKIIARRCAVMGFDKIDDRVGQSRTVVIGGSSDDYIAGQRSVVDQASVGRPQ